METLWFRDLTWGMTIDAVVRNEGDPDETIPSTGRSDTILIYHTWMIGEPIEIMYRFTPRIGLSSLGCGFNTPHVGCLPVFHAVQERLTELYGPHDASWQEWWNGSALVVNLDRETMDEALRGGRLAQVTFQWTRPDVKVTHDLIYAVAGFADHMVMYANPGLAELLDEVTYTLVEAMSPADA